MIEPINKWPRPEEDVWNTLDNSALASIARIARIADMIDDDTWSVPPSTNLERNKIIGNDIGEITHHPKLNRPHPKLNRPHPKLKPAREPKETVGRRIRRMSKSGFSIPIVPLLFMAWAFGFFDSEDEKPKNVDTTKKKVESVANQVKQKTNEVVDKAKKEFNEIGKPKANEKSKVEEKSESYNSDFNRQNDLFKQKNLYK